LPGVGANSAAAMAAIQPVVSKVTTNELDFVQATATRDLMKLDGGPLGLALGVSYVYQDLNGNNYGEACTLATIAGPNCMYAVGDQSVTAVYGELNAPVTKTLELNAAIRYDYYDTYGGTWTPKVGAKWTPIKELAVRGTWGQGFRAPYMTENGDAAFRFGFNTSRDPILCPVSNPDGSPDQTSPQNVPQFCNFSAAYVQGTTKDLEPEESDNWTVGLVGQPTPDWSITVDYYSISVKNQIISNSSLATYDSDNSAVRGIPQLVTYGDGSQGISPVGTIVYYAAGYVNAQKTTTTGLDLGTNYSFKLPDASRLTLGAQWSHIFTYDMEVNGTKYKLAGTHGPSDVSGNTGNPKDRLQLTGQWAKGPFTATLMGNMVGSYDMTDPKSGAFTCEDGMSFWNSQRWGFTNPTGYPQDLCDIDAFWYWNLNVQWQYNKQTMFSLSVINLFNQDAPVDAGAYAGTGVNRTSNQTGIPLNPSLHSVGAVGTSFLLGVTYNF
jgi:iron complex outermembrane receptor protein